MELKLKLRYAGIMMLLFLAMIMIDWYKNIDYVNVYDETIKESVPNGELYKYSSNYTLDFNKDYMWMNATTVKKTKTSVPFIFNREVLKASKRELYLDPRQ
jgi:hypothetical protein